MKKILLLMAVALAFVACTDNSSKGKIEKAFKNYVDKNFDDPKSLKEITDIELGTDTLNWHKLRNGLKDEINIAYSIDSAYYIMYEEVIRKNPSKYAKKNKDEYRSLLSSMMEYSGYKIDNKIDLSLIKNKFDSIFTLDTIVVNDKIKCRINKGGELRLETYTTNRDTLFSNIKISASGAKAEDIYDFYEESNRYLNLSEKLRRQIELGEKTLYKFSQM